MKRALGFMNKGVLLDADAQAFITAAGITDATQKGAINTLVVSLKGYSLWSKMKAIYPFIGGTASTHKYNLKDPRDLDAAFRIVFTTGTHSALGLVCSAAVNLIDTKLIPSSVLSLYNHHISFYNQTDYMGLYADFSAGTDTIPFFMVFSKRESSYFDSRIYNNADGSLYYLQTGEPALGLYSITDTSQTSREAYKNGVSKTSSTNSQPTSSLPSTSIKIGTGTGSPYFSPRTYSFFTIGDGLNDTENANLYTIIQAYQTTLGRQV